MQMLPNCPVCGAAELADAYRGRTTRNPRDAQRWRVTGCSRCGLRFLNPQPTWAELAPYYSANYGAYSPSHGVGDAASEQQIVERARRKGEYRHIPIRENLRLLDVGCGGGSFL